MAVNVNTAVNVDTAVNVHTVDADTAVNVDHSSQHYGTEPLCIQQMCTDPCKQARMVSVMLSNVTHF